jgi:hypothetical protein
MIRLQKQACSKIKVMIEVQISASLKLSPKAIQDRIKSESGRLCIFTAYYSALRQLAVLIIK